MTRYELELAQWLLLVADRAMENADHIDPTRRGPEGMRDPARAALLIRIENIGRNALAAFQDITGKLPHEVDLTELHTERPAPWTREMTRWLR